MNRLKKISINTIYKFLFINCLTIKGKTPWYQLIQKCKDVYIFLIQLEKWVERPSFKNFQNIVLALFIFRKPSNYCG